MVDVGSFQEKQTSWWLWFAVLKTVDSEILLFSVLLPNTAKYLLSVDDDRGDFEVSTGKITYCSKVINDISHFMEEIENSSKLKFDLLDPSLNMEFSISAARTVIGKSFGKSVVPIKSYYTIPDLTCWENKLDDLRAILLLLKNELNLPFDQDYARKFGNFEIHDISISMDNYLSIELMNSSRGRTGSAYVRVAKKGPLLDDIQVLHVICREKKDIIFQKIVTLKKGVAVTELEDLPEDSHELECWVFNEIGDVIFQCQQYYIASIGLNMGVSGLQVEIEDNLTVRTGSNRRLRERVSRINRTTTERSIIQANDKIYEKFDNRMMQIQSDLFTAQGGDQWFGKSIECEIDVIKHFQSLLGGGKAKKAILVDPFFGAEAIERFLTRIEESTLALTILTSLSEINPDTGEKFSAASNPIDLLRNSLVKVKDIVNCNFRLINVNRGSSKQAFHDRYMVIYPFEGLPIVYMLSNSINKMSGNWPFCMSKLEPAIARYVREYIEQLCEGKDNSRDGNPNITFEWPEK